TTTRAERAAAWRGALLIPGPPSLPTRIVKISVHGDEAQWLGFHRTVARLPIPTGTYFGFAARARAASTQIVVNSRSLPTMLFLSARLRSANELHEVIGREPVPVGPIVVVAMDAGALAEIVPRREHEELGVHRVLEDALENLPALHAAIVLV